jgi:hypothetical protein
LSVLTAELLTTVSGDASPAGVLSAVFFLALQRALERAPVDGHAKPASNLREEIWNRERGIVGP